MPETRIHDFSEVPWDEIVPTCDEWSFGRGGDSLPAWQWAVCHTKEDGDSDIYPLPEALCQMISILRVDAGNDVRRQLRDLLEDRRTPDPTVRSTKGY